MYLLFPKYVYYSLSGATVTAPINRVMCLKKANFIPPYTSCRSPVEIPDTAATCEPNRGSHL